MNIAKLNNSKIRLCNVKKLLSHIIRFNAKMQKTLSSSLFHFEKTSMEGALYLTRLFSFAMCKWVNILLISL